MQELLLPILPSNADQANGKKKQQEVLSSGIDITPLESLSAREEEMEAMSQEPQTIDLSSCSHSDDYGSDNYGNTQTTQANHGEIQTLDAENTALLRNVLDVIEEGGDFKKLKVDDLKAYLRYYGLRMIGNKATLIECIQEHLVVKDGGGEAKYRRSTFSLNCTGDVVQGDVVLFEQKVYHSYDFVSRSAAGPPLGKRMVAGRVVSDSYGATKQQHTFTIEVLWSTGVQPLPAMYPLQIKGRNLYRLHTYRQPWRNEEDRQSALVEKHGRGVAARNIRAAAKAQHSHLRSKETAAQKAEHMHVTRRQVQRSFTRTPENTVAGLHSNAGHHFAEKRHCYVPEVAPPSTSSSWSHNPPKSPISTLRGHSPQVTNSFGINIQH
ncbi:hypothetical protein CY35_07G022400 [Sphagnum magellanicum]|uniref:Uncharacterized protein n=2 Tax=Sphagnum magellanicum TaxID=128215 RepID=A0ACB8HKR3_9BRYO|nr:hypothetical protein CY35_07G022400 [Sphagnum magellanicum]